MSARNSLFLNGAILLLYYTCGGIEYISAQPTGVRIFHTLSHGFNIPQDQQPSDSISFDDRNGGYMAIQVERHPWERQSFRYRNGYGPHKNFVIAQPNLHSSEEFNPNRWGNTPRLVLNPAAGSFEAPRVNVALTGDAIIVNHPWNNPHNRRHHHRCHHNHKWLGLDAKRSGEDLQGAGFEAGNFGQTAIFGNTNNGIREWENIGPQRKESEGEEKVDILRDITPTTSTTTRATTPTTTESAERTVEIAEPTTETYETTTTVNNSVAVSTTKPYETTTVNSSVAIPTTNATVTAAPAERTFEIDVRSGLA